MTQNLKYKIKIYFTSKLAFFFILISKTHWLDSCKFFFLSKNIFWYFEILKPINIFIIDSLSPSGDDNGISFFKFDSRFISDGRWTQNSYTMFYWKPRAWVLCNYPVSSRSLSFFYFLSYLFSLKSQNWKIYEKFCFKFLKNYVLNVLKKNFCKNWEKIL